MVRKARTPWGAASLGQKVELLLGRKIGIDHRSGLRRGRPRGDHLGQPVVGLRPEHDVHVGRAGQDFGALGLGDAAGDRQDHAPAFSRPSPP